MGKIRVLDEETINHIAAGEVVERAASVVKELVENAVDAKAKKIIIDLAADTAAVKRISITDDGIGLSAEDAVLAFRQHATSKISKPDDLAEIVTLGFRGEALASIAAVSKVTFTSKERGSSEPEAVQVVIHGGELIRQTFVGAPEGTTIIVEDLFYNTPARRKFQRSVSTELSHIYDMVERIALAHREISFVLLYQGKERFRTYGTGSYPDAVAAVFGTTFARDLLPVEKTGGIAEVSGYVSKPGCNMRPTPTRFYLTINGRQITSKSLQWAVREGYGTLLPKGMYPAAFLDIKIDPREVDVNVHPTKREVRLSRERDVGSAVRDAVYTALHDDEIFSAAPASAKPEQQKLFEEKKEEEAEVRVEKTYVPAEHTPSPKRSLHEAVMSYLTPQAPAEPVRSSLRQTEIQLRRTETSAEEKADVEVPEVLGQIGDTYIACRNAKGELVIVDQHAAHERVMYDQLLKKVEEKKASQELLAPVTLTLSRAESARMPELSEILAQAGYVIEPFGQDVWAVRSVPVISSTLGDVKVIHEIIAEAAGITEKNPERVLDRVVKTVACRAVVKGNTPLTKNQMERLLRQLSETDSPYTCPHGRPTALVLSKEKLASMFLRT
ncbi:MAG TPA: DNA mismatch repair endonuclease MutL [Methanocorpusculum sp.]|jgi:DNA mismatch repair protein MutL|nr:DNA mismatch repair endonuclease MutL [Methanocorpusculum sp.]HJJ65410.1 DNA mismatch repair endonuclease MutL [Methanocorpusculum sp.]